ncbi:type 1 glutamine amidotransferase [Lichenihabitans sp. Uapishka_5]|uniref:type 1 glutamine amidotransferase n=1 Tax=Lichenihabitans sp. Uapishka_5 TaxID=3037302 RepID=UPI0029E7EB4C|nr:type 1 glutamine amidotransferase [Lichenihabitans sp. Uapishka_5]MDX7951973.1 type 1 glutamine amidotransferase [Lichenihabitans sp. Uapishka_5]
MSRPPAFLVSESETAEARQERRQVTGRSSGESFADLLRAMVPGAACELVQTVEAGPAGEPSRDLAGYDAVFLAGSPLHVYEESPAVRRQLSFMQAVFASATPCFGSCAGLQIAVAAAGGRVRQNKRGHEVGIGRRILRTAAGQDHPLLSERPDVFDALSLHSDEVEALPPGSTLLATNRVTTVQAAEIRHDGGVFWGVQYHPELPLEEIADALRRQGEEIVDQKLARSEADVEGYAAAIEDLGRDPGRHDLAWRLGLDEQVTDARSRRSEISMFVRHLVEPTRSQRGRA